MNHYKSTINSKLSIKDIKDRIKKLKASSVDLRYYMIHSNNENQITFGKNKGHLFNLLDLVDTEFKIYPSNSQNNYIIDVKYSNYKPMHYFIILFLLFFVFFFNTFLFMAILGIFKVKFYFVYSITLFIAYYIFSKKPIKSSINTEMWILKRVLM